MAYETPAQQSTAFGVIPTAPIVPGQPPAATPPVAPGGDPTQQINAMAQRIMQAIAQASQRKQLANTPVPGQIPGPFPNESQNIGMNTSNPHAWSGVRFMSGLGPAIANVVRAKKEAQLHKAEGDWTYLQSTMNDLYQAQQSGDPKAVEAAQKKVDFILQDDKKLKNMAKALNQDWLNPEKTTVYGEALKKVVSKSNQTDQQKAQAKQGIMGIFQKLLGQRQRPELSPEQKQTMGREIQSRAPTAMAGGTVKDQLDAAKGMLDLEKAAKEARENYSVMVGTDGTAWAWNKSNPKDAFKLRDHETGDEIKGQVKVGSAPKVLINGGVPYAVQRGGQTVTPDSPDWKKEDQQLFDGALSASKEKQQLRIDPIIADQIGEPPNPKEFAKGRSDPAYAKELAEYGKKAEKIKNEMSAAGGVARAKAFNDYRVVEALDYDEKGNPVTHYMYGKTAMEGGLSSAVQGAKNLSRTKQIEDIEVASDKFKETIRNVDKPFTPAQIALLTEALKAPDETVASAEFQALANQQLTDSQFQLTLWIKQLNERAMSMRGIAGMGQGAQDLRDAIRGTLPHVGIGDKKRMLDAIAPFDNQVKILKGGIPKPGGSDKSTDTKPKDKDPLGIF